VRVVARCYWNTFTKVTTETSGNIRRLCNNFDFVSHHCVLVNKYSKIVTSRSITCARVSVHMLLHIWWWYSLALLILTFTSNYLLISLSVNWSEVYWITFFFMCLFFQNVVLFCHTKTMAEKKYLFAFDFVSVLIWLIGSSQWLVIKICHEIVMIKIFLLNNFQLIFICLFFQKKNVIFLSY